MADTNALAPRSNNQLRDLLSQFDPDKLKELHRKGLLSFEDLASLTAGTAPLDPDAELSDTLRATGGNPARVNMGGYTSAMGSGVGGNVNMTIPVGAANLTPGVNGEYTQGGGAPNSYTLSPSMALALGKLQAQVGQRYATGQKTANTYGGGIDLGPMSLNYQRDQSAMPTNTYSASIPIGDEGAALRARMTQGRGVPTQYGVGANYGNFALEGDYTPSQKAAAMYARYKAQF